MGGCFLDDLRAFGMNADQSVDDCSPGRGGMNGAERQNKARGGTFHGEMDRCRERSLKARLRHAGVVCPNIDGKDQGEDSPKQADSC